MGNHRVATFHKIVLAQPDDGENHRVATFHKIVLAIPGGGNHRVATFHRVVLAQEASTLFHRVSEFHKVVLATVPKGDAIAWDAVIERRFEQPANKILVLGAEDDIGNRIQATAEDADSIEKYGQISGRPIESEAIGTVALAQKVADVVIADRSTPQLSLRFDTPTDGFRAGQLLRVHIPSEGIIEQEFAVIKVSPVERKAGSYVYSVECGDNRPSSEELLRKIEAAFRANQRRRVLSIRCLDFDGTGTGTRTDSGDAALQDLPLADFAVSAWIFPRRKDANMVIARKGDPTGAIPNGWVFRQLSSEGFELRIAQTGLNQVVSTQFGNTIMDVDRWHHVYIDSSGVAYVDGVLQDISLTITNPGSGAYVSDAGDDVVVGEAFEGCLADLRIYRQLLGERPVQEAAAEPFQVRSFAAPLVWWKLDDGDDGEVIATAFDHAGSSRTLTLAGGIEGKVLQHQIPLSV